jgi:hypothetical protein
LVSDRSKLFNYRELNFAPRNMETYVSIDRTSIQSLESPYSNCHNDWITSVRSDISNYFVSNNKTYTRKDCLDYAIQREISLECGCKSTSLGDFENDIKYCDYRQQGCEIKVFSMFDDTKGLICSSECKSMKYNTKTMLNSYARTGDILENLKKLQNDPFFDGLDLTRFNENSSIYHLHFYYEEQYYTEISETAKYTWINLISNLGGSLGLFLGMSLLTFFEIFEFLFKILMIIAKRNVN